MNHSQLIDNIKKLSSEEKRNLSYEEIKSLFELLSVDEIRCV